MNDGKAWHDDDVFWETFGDTIFSDRRLEEAGKDVEDIMALLGLDAGCRLLDLCCGVGRHSVEFAKSGLDVTGVDRTSKYLAKARQSAVDNNLDIEFLEGDMRTYASPESFDAVVNLFTSFGFFDDEDMNRRVVANAYRSLRPGGPLLLDVMGKEIIARIFQGKDWQENEDGTLLLQEREVSRDWSWMENRWIMFAKDGRRREYTVSHALYSARELKELLAGCGFGDVKAYGSLDGSPYDQTARRLVVIGRK